ncbi:major head protein [Bacillus phage Aurora]|uniref:Major head protein n=1 Tax=Bacillus phage Aurora TaxID=1874000 RepID=A0A1B1PAF3_9CAUD|nr:major head protein [Bacillus phage Aurora]ANT41140.1 major head protein [Bacillus phage Aurora]
MAKINMNDVNGLLGSENTAQTLNMIRNELGGAYAKAVPEANDRNIGEVGIGINSNPEHRNSFLNQLVDRIGLVVIKHKSMNNPLGKFKKGTMPLGYTIEEIYTDITKAKKFDPTDAESTLYKREIPDTKAFFHQRNREQFYEQTVSQAELKAAFVSYQNLDNFITGIFEALYNSAEVDEYLWMRKLIDQYYEKGFFHHVKVEAPTSQDSARAFVKKMRAYVRKLTLGMGSRKYNHTGVHTRSEMEGLHLFITAETEAEIDVDVLAVAFNMNKTDFLSKVTVIDEFADPAIQAVLVDEDWFMCYDNNIEMTNVYNPKGLYWNYFYHVWQTLSCSTLENAVVFSTADAPVPPEPKATISPKTASVKAGESTTFSGSTEGEGEVTDKAYAVAGGTKAGTKIDVSTGKLDVDATEEAGADKLTVTFSAKVGGVAVSDTAKVTVTAP